MLLPLAILFPFPGTTLAWALLKVIFAALTLVPIVGPFFLLLSVVL